MEQWLNGNNNTWNSNPDNMAFGMSSTGRRLAVQSILWIGAACCK
jgi:hypothetical protein